MAMTFWGLRPDAEIGNTFRNTIRWFRPLWKYCELVAPSLTAKVQNYGDGLVKRDAIRLATFLRREISSGRTTDWAIEREATLAALPDEKCRYCNGTGDSNGARPEAPGERCKVCRGKGWVRSREVGYCFSIENVRRFAEFLQHSGGFMLGMYPPDLLPPLQKPAVLPEGLDAMLKDLLSSDSASAPSNHAEEDPH
jgi:hypothetical protein